MDVRGLPHWYNTATKQASWVDPALFVTPDGSDSGSNSSDNSSDNSSSSRSNRSTETGRRDGVHRDHEDAHGDRNAKLSPPPTAAAATAVSGAAADTATLTRDGSALKDVAVVVGVAEAVTPVMSAELHHQHYQDNHADIPGAIANDHIS